MGRGPSSRLSASFVVRSYDGGCAEFDSSWLGFPFSRFGAVSGVKRMAQPSAGRLVSCSCYFQNENYSSFQAAS
jgi:hypothetical protein